MPPGTARPNSCVSRSTSPQVAPPPPFNAAERRVIRALDTPVPDDVKAVADGLVYREPHPTHGRILEIYPTDEGLRRFKAARPFISRLETQMCEGYSTTQVTDIIHRHVVQLQQRRKFVNFLACGSRPKAGRQLVEQGLVVRRRQRKLDAGGSCIGVVMTDVKPDIQRSMMLPVSRSRNSSNIARVGRPVSSS